MRYLEAHYYACPYRPLFTGPSNETSQERPLPAAATCDETPRLPYRSGPSKDWIKVKNPDSPAMIRAREAGW
jgi:hypothetical protein